MRPALLAPLVLLLAAPAALGAPTFGANGWSGVAHTGSADVLDAASPRTGDACMPAFFTHDVTLTLLDGPRTDRVAIRSLQPLVGGEEAVAAPGRPATVRVVADGCGAVPVLVRGLGVATLAPYLVEITGART